MATRSESDIYEETLAVFERREDPFEPLSTPEIAARLGEQRRTVYQRLETLVERGQLETKSVGARGRVWWQPSNEQTASANPITRTEPIIDTIVEQSSDFVLHVGVRGSVEYVSDSIEHVLGYEPTDLLGRHALDFIHPDQREAARQAIVETITSTGREVTYEFRSKHANGSWRWLEFRGRSFVDDPAIGGILVTVRDVTRRREREQEYRETALQLEGILDTVDAAIFVKDIDSKYRLMNQNFRDRFGIGSEDEIDGMTDYDLFPQSVATKFRSIDQHVFDTEEKIEIEQEVPTIDGSRTFLTQKSPLFDESGEPYAILAVSTDITEQTERKRELAEQKQFLEAIIESTNDGLLVVDENRQVIEHNEQWIDMWGFGEDFDVTNAETDRIESVTDKLEDPQAFTSMIESVYERSTAEHHEQIHLTDGRVFDCYSAPVTSDEQYYGRVWSYHDSTERYERERTLKRQREQLVALDNLNAVVREITDAVINQSTREEIEHLVCDHLANSDSYSFAWIATVDQSTGDVLLREQSQADGYLSEIDVSANPSVPEGRGPAGKAFRTGKMQVCPNVFENDMFEPWRDVADRYGFSSASAIPITHEGTQYGVIGLYSDRTDAFGEQERSVIGHLGAVVGHAIAAVERKQALFGDELVEVSFLVRDIYDVDELSAKPRGTTTFDRIVPVDDRTYLVYGTGDDDALETIEALVNTDSIPHYRSMTILNDGQHSRRFELKLVDPPILTAITLRDGYVHSSRYEQGDLYVQIHLPPTAHVTDVIDAISASYPNMEMISRRQRTRSDAPLQQLPQVLGNRLTERQQATLEAAYFAGFFEWPRDRSGEDVAESLDIGASTFHQHLRHAEKKLLNFVFSDETNEALN